MYIDLILLVGMPRSGTSWLSQIIDSAPEVRFRLSPLFAYAFKNAVNEHSSKESYEAVLRGAYELEDEFMSQSYRRARGEYPIFQDKHIQPPFLAIKMTRFHHLIRRMLTYFDNLKTVAIVRHPCGAIHSWLTTPGEFPSNADPMEEWRSGACRKTGPEEFWGFEDWKKVTNWHLDLAEQFPRQFRIVRYEQFVTDRENETERLFEYLGLEFGPQTTHYLTASQSRHEESSYAVFKNPSVRDRWRTELSPLIQEEIYSDLTGTRLELFL